MLRLIAPTVRHLGFDAPTHLERVFKCGRDLGFGLNPWGAALYAALQGELIERGRYIFAMIEMIDSDGKPRVFDLHRTANGKLWLVALFGQPDDLLNPDDRVVFRTRS
jgi:hypothetical protein